jgi:hypothetical protein
MGNDYVNPPEGSNLLTAEIEEFQRELQDDYSTLRSLKYLASRYGRFNTSTKAIPGKEGRLCRELLKGAALKLIEGSAKLVQDYQSKGDKGYRVTNGEREVFTDIFLQLTEILEEDLPIAIKNSTVKISDDLARIGGL